ncbi:MAG: type III-B CRISPR module RAMP protein Cmr6, partial [Aquificae bacterium]|nr:type III-B CRISPR module RAMP protein Cmr6 [Aquificota bacterium]
QLLDALPEEFELGIDLINPHFKEYYQSGEQERQRNATFLVGEWHNPVPVPFLVVEEATFKVFYKGAEKKVEELLKKALNLLGVGGKKGKGYGRLEPT